MSRCSHRLDADLLVAALDEKPWQILGCGRTRYYSVARKSGLRWLCQWRKVASLSHFAGQGKSAEQVGLLLGVDTRSARRTAQTATGVPWREFALAVGWEWVVERALRRSGVRLRTLNIPLRQNTAPVRLHPSM